MKIVVKRFPIIVFSLIAGCHGAANKPAPTKVNPPEQTWKDTQIAVPASPSRPVKEGEAPLVFLIETASIVRVVDATTGEDLLRMPMSGRTIVAVDQKNGVKVGGAVMRLGPLPERHRYAIYLETNETNTIRSGSIRPGKPAVPATQPELPSGGAK